MEKLLKIIENLDLENQLTLEEIPAIDLYMDQVIQLFENKFANVKRNEEEKVLTKTMINNYAKGKLLFPIKNKKYSKDHLILISLIYQLKGALSINDIKTTLKAVNERAGKGTFTLDEFYKSYLQLQFENTKNFKQGVKLQEEQMNEHTANLEDSGEASTLEPVLMIASLVHMSNLYRRAAEKLVDELTEKPPK